ncbi:MAG TPA: CHASE3 domain-containing protein [Drouetiella sp.]
MRVSKKLTLIAAGTISIIIVVGATSLLSVANLIKANEQVSQSKEIVSELNLLLADLTDTVASQRAYIISGKEPYFDSYRRSIPATLECVDTIRTLVADSPTQSGRAEKLSALVKDRLASLDVTLQLYKTKGPQAAFDRIKNGNSLSFKLMLQSAIDEMKQHELALLEKRDHDMRRSASTSQMTIVAGCLLALAFVTIFNYLFGHSFLSCIRQLIRAADNIKHGRFDLSIDTNTEDEFAELATAFNTVGQQLQLATGTIEENKKNSAVEFHTIQVEKESAQDAHDEILTKFALILGQVHATKARLSLLLEELETGSGRIEESTAELHNRCRDINTVSQSMTKDLLELRTASDAPDQFVSVVDGLLNKLDTLRLAADIEHSRASESNSTIQVFTQRLREVGLDAQRDKQELLKASARARLMTNDLVECYGDAVNVIEDHEKISQNILSELARLKDIIKQLNKLDLSSVLEEHSALSEQTTEHFKIGKSVATTSSVGAVVQVVDDSQVVPKDFSKPA